MKKYVAYSVAAVILAISLFFLKPNGVPYMLASGIVIGLAFALFDAAIEHSRYLRLAWHALINHDEQIRFSISYLFRICVDGEYLLVRSARYGHFQPVGGVYKAHPSAQGFFRRIGVMDDNYLPVDDYSRADLRVRVLGRHLVAFIRWFESGHNREVGAWREFEEELIASQILPGESFRTIAYDYIRREYRPLRYSAYAQSKELLIADIFELIPTPEQTEALRELRARGDERVRWVSEDLIVRRGSTPGQGQQMVISEHTEWTLG